MSEYRFWQVDCFSTRRYLGNPAAVVFDADELTDDQMQMIARQMNLSETVFLCAPQASLADYRARIFTPRSELPFAGHPTIAAAYSHHRTRGQALKSGALLRQECGIGIVPVALTEPDNVSRYTMTVAADTSRDVGLSRTDAAALLGLAATAVDETPAEVCSIGAPWLVFRVKDLATLKGATPDLAKIETVSQAAGAVGVSVYAPGADTPGCSVHVRSFAPGDGIAEDPVCGSGNGAVAIHMARHYADGAPQISYVAEQGQALFRQGVVHLDVTGVQTENMTVRLGGNAVTVMEGVLAV